MASRKAEDLLNQYLVSRAWLKQVLQEEPDAFSTSERKTIAFRKRDEARKVLLDYIGEIEAKAEGKERNGN